MGLFAFRVLWRLDRKQVCLLKYPQSHMHKLEDWDTAVGCDTDIIAFIIQRDLWQNSAAGSMLAGDIHAPHKDTRQHEVARWGSAEKWRSPLSATSAFCFAKMFGAPLLSCHSWTPRSTAGLPKQRGMKVPPPQTLAHRMQWIKQQHLANVKPVHFFGAHCMWIVLFLDMAGLGASHHL